MQDYLNGMADSADLVVIGANFGSGSKGGMLSTFLMGVYDPKTSKWKTVCKVLPIISLVIEIYPRIGRKRTR